MEVFIVQAEYLDLTRMTPYENKFCCGASMNYELAKKRCHDTVEEDRQEGTIPEEGGEWNEYGDEFLYEDDSTRVLIYVESIDLIEE